MLLLIGAFLAGFLTVLAPCVLPLLPIIIGGAVSGEAKDRKRPFLVVGSLAVSLILFTLLLKATTLFINVPPQAILYFSGGIIVALGIVTLFPRLYTTLLLRFGLESRAQRFLGMGVSSKHPYLGPILTGAALGPVFSSCNPIYGYIIATILPVNFNQAFAAILAYVVGLALILLLVTYFGRRFIQRIRFASNPNGAFQRAIGVLFILVGIGVATGLNTKLQVYAAEHSPVKLDQLSAGLIPKSGVASDDTKLYNVEPYDAPELVGLQNWINSQPQTLASLRGKVVLIDFWTYSCINCIRSVPHVQKLYETYRDSGFTVIGVHAPEFAFEQVPSNVQKAVRDYKLTYPVALDNDLATWNAFQNQYWPAEYLIDVTGKIRRTHFGEGEYGETESAVRGLLQEAGKSVPAATVEKGAVATQSVRGQTPETYLGAERAARFAGQPSLDRGPSRTFSFPDGLKDNEWALAGNWMVDLDGITAGDGAKLRLKASARNVYLVASAPSPSPVRVLVDGRLAAQAKSAGSDVRDGAVTIADAKLYRLVDFGTFARGRVVELEVPVGTRLNVFTFGS